MMFFPRILPRSTLSKDQATLEKCRKNVANNPRKSDDVR